VTRARPLRLGVLAGAVYLVALAATALVTTQHVRPLFEGIGPAAPYRWVNPPREFAAGNQPPAPLKGSITLGPPAALNTSDGQVIVTVGAGGFAAHGADTTIDVAIDPLDPATLGPAPAPLRADGNAYRIALTYRPSGAAVGPLAAAGNIALQVPEPAETILFSTDGHAWQRLDAHTAGQPTLEGATFTQPGFYLAATSSPLLRSGGSSNWPAYAAFIGAVVLAATLGITTELRRRRSPSRAAARARDRKRASATRPATKPTKPTKRRR
jgi:hypothetical protein